MQNTIQAPLTLKAAILLLVVVATVLIFPSCKKCELIEQVITDPPVDTMATCEGVFYINEAGPDIDLSFFFNEFNKPIPSPFEYAAGPGPNPVGTLVYNIESNFSAYDSINRQYVFEYYYTNGGPVEVLFHHQNIATGVATFTSPMTAYAAPVFLNGALYAIQTELVNTSVLYQIFQLNPVTGQQLGLMYSGFLTANSPFTAATMSSVSNGRDLIYFLSGTTLVELNVENLVAKQINLEPNFHPVDNVVQFFGLEYKRDENLLIAMKNSSINMASTRTDLVSIEPAFSTATVTQLFNITANLPVGQDGQINAEFYSSTFDPCDNTYYITERQEVNPATTNFFEINLNTSAFTARLFSGYWYGNEYSEVK